MNYRDLYQLIERDLLHYLQSDAIMGQRVGALVEPGSTSTMVNHKVNTALGAGTDGKVGLGYLILPIEDLMDDDPEVTFGPLRLPIGIQIIENVVLNQGTRGTKYPLRMLAAYCQKILKAYSAQNLTTDLIPDKNAINLFTSDRDENLRVCQINLHTYESDPAVFLQVGSPFLTPSALVSVIAGQNVYPINVGIAAPGATVYYTLDGTHPWSGNTAAVKWDGVSYVAITQPAFFRARAFIAGQTGSKTSSIYFA